MSGGTRRRSRMLMGALFAATLIAVSVLPSLSVSAAAEKIYDLNVTPSSAIAGSSVDFFVKITNRTPGNSNANSFTITAPSGFVVTAASISTATNPNPTVDVDVVSPSTVTVTGIDPIKRDQFVEVKVRATTPSIAPDCSEAQPPWTATVHTGTSLNGSTFALNNPGAAQVTTLLSCLTLAFVDGFAPADGAVGTGQTVKVEAVGDSAS